jgi:hypothetical protein
MPDFTGLAYMAVVGLGTVILAITLLPVAGLWGLAWLIEPRGGSSVWIIQEVLSTIWVLVCAAFFGSAIAFPLIARWRDK